MIDQERTLPEWSGLWLELEEVGYMEISDWDTRMHKAPSGWQLADIDVCVEHSSQIFRYVRIPASVRLLRHGPTAALTALTLAGVGVGARPIIHALAASFTGTGVA